MLIDFTFENFKCYRDETRLEMEAASIDEHSDSLVITESGRTLLPVAVIYGPNGGGKSSVLQAFQYLCNYVTLPYLVLRRLKKDIPTIACKPYAFEPSSSNASTTFRVVFSKGEHVYRYILSVSNGAVQEEYLHRRKAGKGATATVFERFDGKVVPGSALKRKRVSVEVDPMLSYLAFLAINYDFDLVDEPFDWFRSCCFLDYSEADIENFFVEPKADREKKRVVALLNSMDIDITDVRFERGKDDNLEGIYLSHSASGEFELELEDESNGTRKLLSLTPIVLMALDAGMVVVSDELDAKLHPKLLKYLIRLFTNKKTNPNGAQLIFTSHDMSTLSSSVFRRDEIWFAARAADGAAQLYSLVDIAEKDGRRIRTQNAYDRQYLAGRYGADPYLRNMLEWDEADEQ